MKGREGRMAARSEWVNRMERDRKGREGSGRMKRRLHNHCFAELVEEMGKLADEQLQLLEKQVEEEKVRSCDIILCVYQVTFDPTEPTAWHAETSRR